MQNSTTSLRSTAEIRLEFARRGLSISGWARLHGYSAQLVYGVLTGRNRGLRGQSHEIAVRLGLKHGLIGRVSDIDALVQGAPTEGAHSPRHGGDPET
ncbi:DNA-binding protein [Pseudoxanthomonas mexicana]|uniref:DNA-binding protein n=1 Tax=Pseudoxanthomonas mexicana TaxID=128785 RepID=UPI003CE49C3B